MTTRKKLGNWKNGKKERKISRSISTLESNAHSSTKSKQSPKSKRLRLSVDLVPKSQWYKNLRKQVRPIVWDKLRKEIYTQAGHKCQVCGAEGKLHCHEKWDFDEKNLIQRLVGFEALCALCHLGTHLGMALILADKGDVDFEKVVLHFIKVNKLSEKEFFAHIEEAEIIYKKRSKLKWKMDYAQWEFLLPTKPVD